MADLQHRSGSPCPSGKMWCLPSEQLAVNTATLLTWKRGEPFYAYDCPLCPDWHVTRSQPSSSKREEDPDAEETDEDP